MDLETNLKDFNFHIDKFQVTKQIEQIKNDAPIQRFNECKKFDDCCFVELSDLFNKNSKWKRLAEELDYGKLIESWQKLRNPTKVLLIYTEVSASFY